MQFFLLLLFSLLANIISRLVSFICWSTTYLLLLFSLRYFCLIVMHCHTMHALYLQIECNYLVSFCLLITTKNRSFDSFSFCILWRHELHDNFDENENKSRLSSTEYFRFCVHLIRTLCLHFNPFDLDKIKSNYFLCREKNSFRSRAISCHQMKHKIIKIEREK